VSLVLRLAGSRGGSPGKSLVLCPKGSLGRNPPVCSAGSSPVSSGVCGPDSSRDSSRGCVLASFPTCLPVHSPFSIIRRTASRRESAAARNAGGTGFHSGATSSICSGPATSDHNSAVGWSARRPYRESLSPIQFRIYWNIEWRVLFPVHWAVQWREQWRVQCRAQRRERFVVQCRVQWLVQFEIQWTIQLTTQCATRFDIQLTIPLPVLSDEQCEVQ